MTVGLYCSRPQYADHALPIWEALSPEHRGPRCAPRDAVWAPDGRPGPYAPDHWIVASYSDARALGERATIYVNHGAGQTYDGDPRSKAHGAFVGGDGMESIRLFLDPRQECSDRWTARYPQAVAIPVGCPKMDRWHRAMTQPRVDHEPTIALTFHHQGGLCPETTWALPHYRAAIGPSVAAWRAAGYRVVGHGHPLAEPSLRRLWAEHSVPWVTVDEMFDQADVLVVDNSSLGYEFASLDRPVLWLNAPWYRRGVDHGMRFWSKIPGIAIDSPEELTDAAYRALDDPSDIACHRRRITSQVYDYTDGKAGTRAADAVRSLAEAHSRSTDIRH